MKKIFLLLIGAATLSLVNAQDHRHVNTIQYNYSKANNVRFNREQDKKIMFENDDRRFNSEGCREMNREEKMHHANELAMMHERGKAVHYSDHHTVYMHRF